MKQSVAVILHASDELTGGLGGHPPAATQSPDRGGNDGSHRLLIGITRGPAAPFTPTFTR
jgi:hypothetical protein